MKTIHRAGALSLVALSLSGVTASADTVALTLLHSFSFDAAHGKGHVSSLTVGPHVGLYGTTYKGGANGYGTVFKLTPPASDGAPWTFAVIHSFCSQDNCADGSYPMGGLLLYHGALYGTTTYGGKTCGHSGCGTIFKLTPPASAGAPWTHAVIYHFRPPTEDDQPNADGTNPFAGLIVDQQGVLYGTTNGGGRAGYGTAFKLQPIPNLYDPWTETVINSFTYSRGDGAYPEGGLVFYQGNLYGTTSEGGSNGGYGTVFKLTKPADPDQLNWPETVLYSFAGGNDGAYPKAGLAAGSEFDIGPGLYGTTTYAGANCDSTQDCGTVFKMAPPGTRQPAWTLSTLHSFSYESRDGHYPSGVTIGTDGNLYGTTEYGGYSGKCGILLECGTIFKVTTNGFGSWKERVIYRFCDLSYNHFCRYGAYPTAGLTSYKGAFFGTTSYQGDGAACSCGTVFEIPGGNVPDGRTEERNSSSLRELLDDLER